MKKTIVVDFDDTLSFTTNRDWENATPNVVLIYKLNKLYDSGYDIKVITARGNISCASRHEADLKYREGIESWLIRNKVKFTDLSFDKPLAEFYIDDKGITPEDFISLEFEELTGGLSGAYIERRGDIVYKTQKDAIIVANWYHTANKLINNFSVHSVIGDTIAIPFIEKTHETTSVLIDPILETFSKAKPLYDFLFSSYIDRICGHMELYNPEYKHQIKDMLENISHFMNNNSSFSHGDFSIDNMITNNNTLYLIDPNSVPDLYSSYLLDLAKLKVSCRRFNETELYDYYDNSKMADTKTIKLLEITHWIRMRKYLEVPTMADTNIERLLNEI
jgi:capsule biosynthesis phosphatase